jgi:PadR family transcriptional regulator AphA
MRSRRPSTCRSDSSGPPAKGRSTRELKQLAEAGFVTGESSPQGERKRTVYTLTAAGRKELSRWIERLPETFELRDEGLLKLFFAGGSGPESVALAGKRRYHKQKLEQLRAIEPLARVSSDPVPYLVLRYGIELSEWTVEWCRRTERELSRTMGSAA